MLDIVFDVGMTIEGLAHDNDELPECLMWSFRMGCFGFPEVTADIADIEKAKQAKIKKDKRKSRASKTAIQR